MPEVETVIDPQQKTAPPGALKRRLRALGKAALKGVGALLIVVGGFYGYLQVTHNFHEVEPGLYYRSAQMTPDDLDATIRQHGIRSVLNLRGKNIGTPWYDKEIGALAGTGVTHLDYAISAREPVSPKRIAEIQALIDGAPKPILVHCWDGADRTGLVTAVYRLSRGADAGTAGQELSIRYGHFPYLGSKSRAMDDSFNAYLVSRNPPPATSPAP
ncbi:MAG: tyrosine-protein phosphatase [Bacteroidota bacterium]